MLRSWELLIKIYKYLWKKMCVLPRGTSHTRYCFQCLTAQTNARASSPKGETAMRRCEWELSYSEWDCWGLCRFQLPICPNTCGQSPARARLGYLSDFMCQTVVRPNKLSFSVFCAWTRPFVFLVCPLTICAPLTQQDWSTSTSHLAAVSLRYGLCTTPHASSTMRGVGA